MDSTEDKYQKIKIKFLNKKKEYLNFYYNILLFIKKSNISNEIITRIKKHLNIEEYRNISILSDKNCFLVDMKSYEYFNFIKNKKYENYNTFETFDNTDNLFNTDSIKTNILNEYFMKVEKITIHNYKEKLFIQKNMEIISNIIILIVEPKKELKYMEPFWNIYQINKMGYSGPFTNNNIEYI